jgi:hypothetical protein
MAEVFVSAVIVEDQVQLQFAGHRRIDGFKKAFELGAAVTLMELSRRRCRQRRGFRRCPETLIAQKAVTIGILRTEDLVPT